MIDPLEQLRGLFVVRCQQDLDRLKGLAADDPEVGQIAHRLAGSAGSFGFPEISHAAAVVDDHARHSPPPRPEDIEDLIRLLEKATGDSA